MQYRAKPVVVEAFVIQEIGHFQGAMTLACTLESGEKVIADAGMLARYVPEPGDYWVIQDDGYVYINPRAVFKRKYEPVEQ